MRYYELLERVAPKDYSRSEVSKIIRKEINRSGEPDAWSINNGWCWAFANKLAKILGPEAKVVNSSEFKDGTFPGHSWVLYKGYHFDAESPFGEKEPKQMQYHRRLRAIADSPEDSDEDEIVRKALGHDPIYPSKHNYEQSK